MRKKAGVLVFSVLLWLSLVTVASAQGFGGFLTAGMGSIDYIDSREYEPQVSGGALLRLGSTRVSVGGQADLLISSGYPGGRGGPVAQFDLLPPRAKVQPLVSGGYFLADGGARWMIGGGVDVRFTRKAGVRLAVQDAFAKVTVFEPGRPDRRVTSHEPSLQFGLVYR